VPELPEVEALAHHLRANAVGHPVARVDPASMSALKTFDPPASALVGRTVTGAADHPINPKVIGTQQDAQLNAALDFLSGNRAAAR